MTRIHERLTTDLPVAETFDFIANFANSHAWDPGTAWSRRTESSDGPIAAGTTFELGVRMGGRVAPMTYRITHFERPTRVVLVGEGSGVASVDDIRFEPSGSGTAIDYAADISLQGIRRLLQPFLGGTFKRIGRDAAAGMRDALAALATSGPGAGR
jgi:carbon monoxide dehydrogenase subunit G